MIRKILSSAASNSVALAVSVVITFVMTPIYVRELGDYDYGIWQVIMSVVGYLGLIDLGLRPTISRFTAFCHGAGGPRQSWDPHSVFVTSLVLMAAAGGIAGAALALWSVSAPHALAPDSDPSGRYATVLQLIAIRLVFAFPGFSLQSTLEGRLFYTVKNTVEIAFSVVSSAFLIVFLPRFDPLILLSAVTAGTSGLKLLTYYGCLQLDAHGGYRFRVRYFDRGLALEMIRFGSKALVQSLAAKAVDRTPPIAIGSVLGAQSVVFYSLPKALLSRFAGSLSPMMAHAMMPAFTRMHAAGDLAGIERYFMYGSKITYAATLAACMGIGILGDEFIALWVGESYATRASEILLLMSCSWAVAGSVPLHNRLLTAKDMHGKLALIAFVKSTSQAVLMIALVFPLGITGVVIADLIGNLLFMPMVWRLTFSALEATPSDYLRRVIAPVTLSVAGMGVVLLLAGAAYPSTTWLTLFGHVGLGMVVYGGLVWKVGFRPEERSLILRSVMRRESPKLPR